MSPISTERITESGLAKAVEYLGFRSLETIGTIMVTDIARDNENFIGSNIVRLDFPNIGEEEHSQWIFRVPDGWIETDQLAEVLVKRQRRMPSMEMHYALVNAKRPEKWLVAIRPFDRTTYGKPLELSNPILGGMFRANIMSENIAPAFYEKFIKERS